ncbi:MAG: PadR family transcriptional regulator [Actinobacteria bacterium]|nr:PadR family transcriptional regulator [Actinomycetota bacterium]
MVLDLAILGLLKEQPLHGYELKKRLGDTLGFLGGVSFGSLYPALRRLEDEGSIESADGAGPSLGPVPMPATGSVSGEVTVGRIRRGARAGRRTRKAYRITDRGDARLRELLVEDAPAGNDERVFALKFAFCRHLPREARLELLQRRRADLGERLARAREAEPPRADRYTRSLVEHRTESIERDLEWVDELITAERRQLPRETPEGATA